MWWAVREYYLTFPFQVGVAHTGMPLVGGQLGARGLYSSFGTHFGTSELVSDFYWQVVYGLSEWFFASLVALDVIAVAYVVVSILIADFAVLG
jgi:hypothetical protein